MRVGLVFYDESAFKLVFIVMLLLPSGGYFLIIFSPFSVALANLILAMKIGPGS